jgi:hypothetical protein
LRNKLCVSYGALGKTETDTPDSCRTTYIGPVGWSMPCSEYAGHKTRCVYLTVLTARGQKVCVARFFSSYVMHCVSALCALQIATLRIEFGQSKWEGICMGERSKPRLFW